MNGPAILGPDGAAALAMAGAQPDPHSLAAASALRRNFDAQLASEALTQIALRRAARSKFGDQADSLFLTPDGLEQATRRTVADWRADRFARAGVTAVIDLGCGIGADALGFQRAGLSVLGVELDPRTAAFAAANLGETATVLCGDVEQLAPDLLATAHADTAVFIDPARRTGSGRTWRVEDFQPGWGLVRDVLDSGHPACVKLGPGLPRELIPAGVEACWVSDHGDVVEAGLWRLNAAQPSTTAAVLLPAGARLDRPAQLRQLTVRRPGRYVLEPDGAVIRSGLLSEVAPAADLWLLEPDVAYLSADEPVSTPFATVFEVLEILDYSVRTLKAWVRDNGIGTLEIKKRAIDVDPAALRRQLRPKGPGSATLILARTIDGTRALVCRRMTGQPAAH